MSDITGIDPLSILGKIFELYTKDQEKAAENQYKQEVLGGLETIQRQLDKMYIDLSMLSALLQDEVNRLPVNITRGQIGGFLGTIKDSWNQWHGSKSEAKSLFWKGDELFNRLIADAHIGSPPLQYAVVTDLVNLFLVQVQTAEVMGDLLLKQDRITAFNSYMTFLQHVATKDEPGSLQERFKIFQNIIEKIANDANSIQAEEKQLKIGSIGKDGFSPQAFEDCYRENTPDPNSAQWRVRVYAWGGPNFTPPFNNVISPEMFVSYIKNSDLIPSLSTAVKQHNQDWTDQNALIAHAIFHQDAINIPIALINLLETKMSDIKSLMYLSWNAAILAEKKAK